MIQEKWRKKKKGKDVRALGGGDFFYLFLSPYIKYKSKGRYVFSP